MQKTPPQQSMNNPHSSAAGTYAQHAQTHATDPREVEARALLKANQKMQDLQSRWDSITAQELDETLRYNRQIWMMFFDNAIEDKNPARPNDLRSNIVNLASYIFKRTIEILSDPKREKLDILVDINREIAAGLMTRPKPDQQESK